MKRLLFLFLLVLSVPGIISAQLKDLTLEDCFLKVGALAPSNLKQLNWIPGTTDFYWVKKDNGKDFLVKDNAAKAGESVVVSLDDLNTWAKTAGGSELKGFPFIHFTDATHFWFDNGGAFTKVDLAAKSASIASQYNSDSENQDFHDNGNIAYTIKNELYVALPGKGEVAVTTGSADGIENGKSAHRNEFGIEKGTFWSPKGNLLAFYRVDESMVTTYPIMEMDSRPATARMIRYPMAGAKSHHATIGVFDTRTSKTLFLKTGEPAEQYLTNITFSPDEKFIYVAVLNRGQNHMKLNQYDAATGNFIKTLFEEKHDKFVEPKHGLIFFPNSTTDFLWMSKRDGFNHLYHYNTEGKLIAQVTSGNWTVMEMQGFDTKAENIFISTTNPSPAERHTYKLNLKTKEMTALTQGAGNHYTLVQSEGKFLLDNHTALKVTREIKLADAKGKALRTVFTSPDNTSAFALGETRLFTLKASDGQDLHCRMTLPVGFDANKKYPVIVYVYGGPGIQMVTDGWLGGAGLWMHYAAEKGYIVFSLDNRGSANRGLAFEQATFRDLGTVEIEDQLKGVDYLRSLPYVDANRMGVYGWSYGGFMTTSLMLRAPGTFKVGVAGGPVIDWRMYEIMYTERYMDTPQENQAGYDNSSLLSKVKNLQGKLLLIHGTSDDVVVWQHSLEFLKSCVTEGVQVDYFVYPGHLHNVTGKDRVHLFRKVLDYLMENI